MGSFIHFVLDAILGLLVLAIIISAILSWLVAFDIVNYRNRFVYSVATFLESVTGPLLYPLRRFIPPIGGVDITPIIALLLIQGIRGYLLPMAMAPLKQLLG
ncbi:MAG TPA: YggT family protein [Caulobacteraceae bacterium]|nr:YggT family protein [Caulobacteraceae bacterium]